VDRERLANGLRLARQIAMTSYRCADEFEERFGRSQTEDGRFEVESYLEHQGEKINARFSPYSYLKLTQAMESYDLAAGRGPLEAVVSSIQAQALFVGISSDILYPLDEIAAFAECWPHSKFRTLYASHGHDSFLIDTEELSAILAPFLNKVRERSTVEVCA
jgi:homoserine O-acetyltransferase